MARRTTSADPQRPVLTVVQKRQCIAKLGRRLEELAAFDPKKVTKRFTDPNVTALETAIDEALSAAFGHSTVEYRRYERATSLDHGSTSMQVDPMWGRHNGGAYLDEAQEARQFVAEGKQEALALLRQAVRSLTEEVEEEIADQTYVVNPSNAQQKQDNSKAFVVHGHDEGAREAIARFLEKLGITAIILHEQANQGRTVIEKVEAHGEGGWAIVLLTADDEGCLKGETPKPRARQNVVLELGYFIGRLGRKRVCALKRGELEIPSDFGGVVYETFDAGGGWKSALGRELEAAGFYIDWNVVMRP